MAQGVKMLAVQGWGSEFISWNPCKGERRQQTPKLSYDLHTHSVTCAPTHVHHGHTQIKIR